jgi:hypothetical protein
MRKIKTILLLIFTGSLFFISCKKNGTGGKADISATVIHHDHNIPFSTIHIKYGAKDFPGTNLSNYDYHIQTDANGHADIKDLRYGDYYLYGTGYDSTIMSPIGGGDHLNIKWSQRNKTIAFTVPVTEL